ncbi:glycosyltransferase family A protein [Vagococcus fluvialis]|uniref:glycosyltransferase family A protein n=1 Tax=Vagococcus fluvialis TaxID=2738 RepID=UPI00143293A5|nr:glycosyltransferase family 2 protein [Vagococcus fluvialis]NKC59718.1 glycosyltransferase family 2 protein [Vagococcus fluvialis]NKD50615.1 glycosyltransferase family 2 protein [Vagococcus fluvialis]
MNKNHTFVICAYGDSEFLEACIDSLNKQTIKSEIILYTSTPSEKIEKLCQLNNFSMYTAEGGSIGKDWNNALSFVKTKYATIAHQDDVYLPTYTEEIMALFDKNQEGLIAYSAYREWKEGAVIPLNTNLKIKNLMLGTINLAKGTKWIRRRVMALGSPICCPAVTYNLDLLKDFRFNEEMKVSLDWLAWHDISQYKGKFLYTKNELMWHRIHEESETSNTISDNTRTKEDMIMFNKFWPKPIANFLMKYYVKSQETNQ